MLRDVGVMRFLVDTRPPGSEPILQILALPGDLLVIVPVVLSLMLYELLIVRHSGQEDEPLIAPQVWSLVGIVLGGLALIVALESVFALPRPPADLRAVPASPSAFPSGHTMAATVTWATIARYYRPANLPVRLGSVGGIIVMVGIARMSLGLHYLPDILAGVAFGLIYVYLAGKFTYAHPSRAFEVAILSGTSAAVLSAAHPRGLLAFSGALGGWVAWRLVEYSPMRRYVRQVSRTEAD